MPYSNNVPQANQSFNATQGPILNNFQAIEALVTVNHGDFDTVNQGKHLFVSMPIQSVDPVTAAAEMALYTKTSALTGLTEMFIERESNGTVTEFTSSTAAVNGWTRLPSGILLKWGSQTQTGKHTVLFPVGATVPVFANIFTILVSVANPVGADSSAPSLYVQVNNYNTTQFVVFCTNLALANTPVTFSYLAIGN